MKKFLIICFIFHCLLPVHAAGTVMTYTIDPEKNAFMHNNLGVMYVEEKYYPAAIQEFKIAISLSPNAQASAVYYNNLGSVYMKIGYPQLALDCFKRAITQYSLNLEYYQNLAKCYKALSQINAQINVYKKSTLPTDKILLGLLYEQIGDKKKAIIILDEFAMSEPNLLITPAVKYHIQTLVNNVD